MKFSFKRRQPRLRRVRLQAVIACLGLVIVLGCAAVLIKESLIDADSAQLSVQVLEVEPVTDGRQLTVRVANRGGRTASEVAVSASAAGEEVQSVIDYVPARSSQKAVFIVPTEGEIEVGIDSWVDP